MCLNVFQKGFHYAQDGPGNRLVVHLQGCNMHCPWCSNPEGMAWSGGNTICIEDLIAEAVLAKPMFFDCGGVTFTGGEATVQFDGLQKALIGLKKESIHTAIETNGTHPRFPELLEQLDYLIMDFKHPDCGIHKAVTGVGNEQIRTNLRQAAASSVPLLVRVPMIEGFNADDLALEGFLEFFSTIQGEHVSFELLKYHEYGKDKWKACGKVYTMENAFVEETKRRRWEDCMMQAGLRMIRT